MKLVSVIVLSYRSAETIVETLDSIKNQTYPNIELIVTDDASPDNTVQVVRKWIAENKGALASIKLITSDKNTGLPANINRGLKVAKGTYYKGIAGDDYMTKDAIESYVQFCERIRVYFRLQKYNYLMIKIQMRYIQIFRHIVTDVMRLLGKSGRSNIACY